MGHSFRPVCRTVLCSFCLISNNVGVKYGKLQENSTTDGCYSGL
jgi:hypothetical protein